MNESLIAQYLHFISECKTIEEVKRLDFRFERAYKGSVPVVLLEAIENKKEELTKPKI